MKWLEQDIPLQSQNSLSEPSERSLPGRLIDVGEHPSPTDDIRLVETASIKPSGALNPGSPAIKYIALSHRWSTSNHFTTETASLERRMARIPLESLPATYRDTVVVARKLAVRYAWIDALCIVQDDANDWLEQSAIMGNIYVNAICTVAAHSATDDTKGFLEPSLSTDNTVLLGVHSAHNRGEGVDVVLACPVRRPEREIGNSPLSRRGWIVQERLLSPRVIHFVPNGIYLEYLSTVYLLTNEGPKACAEWTPSRPDLLSLNPFMIQTPSLWFNIVEMYSECNLSFKQDKLVAIAGLAKIINDRSQVPYYAGLWADNILSGLLWLAKCPMLTHPGVHRAPSWSWASLDGPIQWPAVLSDDRIAMRSHITRLHVKGFGSAGPLEDPTCVDISKRIILRAPLGKVSISSSCREGPEAEIFLQGKGTVLSRKQTIVGNRIRELFRAGSDSTVGWAAFDLEDGGDRGRRYSEQCFCAVVASFDNGNIAPGDLVLVLAEVEEAGVGLGLKRYRRIGMGHIYETKWMDTTCLTDVILE